VRAAFVIAAKDLRQRLRDRSALVLGFVAPLAIAGLMSFAFRGAENFHVTVAYADRDGGEVAAGFEQVLRSDELADLLTLVEEPSATAAAQSVRDRDAGAAIVVPEGFSDAVGGAGEVEIDVLTSIDEQLAGDVVRAIVGSFAAQVDAVRLSVATAIAAGAPVDEREQLATAAAAARVPEAATLVPVGAEPVTPISYYAPGMAIFFVFFGVGFGAQSFHAERRDGTLDRIVSAPVRPSAVLAGKAMSVFVYGLLSLATVAVVTSLVFGAKWGPPLAAAAICVAMMLAIVALTAFVIVVARSDRQAEGLAAIVVFGLALLGGNFVFSAASSEPMRRLALATPNGWALRGLTDLGSGAGAGAAVRPVLAILAFTAVVAVVAVSGARRAVSR
jgi:ABC-2 type transport system permease protein